MNMSALVRSGRACPTINPQYKLQCRTYSTYEPYMYVYIWYIAKMNINNPHICVHCTLYIYLMTLNCREREREREREKSMIIIAYTYMFLFMPGIQTCFLGSIGLQLDIDNAKNRCLVERGGGQRRSYSTLSQY